MGFHVVYVADGDINTVRKVKYVDRIRNFAYLTQPWNKMVLMNIPAIAGVYDYDYTTPDEELEFLSFVVTCSGYGENDYYNIYVNNELWFDTWFPTEVKEGLYLGTSTYVRILPPKSVIKVKFVNMQGTSKKVWFGMRFLREPNPQLFIDPYPELEYDPDEPMVPSIPLYPGGEVIPDYPADDPSDDDSSGDSGNSGNSGNSSDPSNNNSSNTS